MRNKEELKQVGFRKFSAFFFSLTLTLTCYFTKPVSGSSEIDAWLRVAAEMVVSLSLLCHLSAW